MSRYVWLVLAAFCLLLLSGTTHGTSLPVDMSVPAGPVSVGEEFDIDINVDTSQLPDGLISAGLRLIGANPYLDVLNILPGPEFASGLLIVQTSPPDPGFLEGIAPLAPSATGPLFATFKVRATNTGTAFLSLDFWALPSHLGGTFDHYVDAAGTVWDEDVTFGTASIDVVPEPSTLCCMAIAAIGAFASRRRRRMHGNT